MWNKAKAIRGASILLQMALLEKDRALSDRCLSLSASSRAFSTSVVAAIEATAQATSMNQPREYVNVLQETQRNLFYYVVEVTPSKRPN